jgi:hypothetical protein
VITRLTPGVLLPPDHQHEFKILIHITLLDMITITVIDHGMSLSHPLLNYLQMTVCYTGQSKQQKTTKNCKQTWNNLKYGQKIGA